MAPARYSMSYDTTHKSNYCNSDVMRQVKLSTTTVNVRLIVTLYLLLICTTGEAVKCSMCDTAGDHGESCLTHPPPARECDGMGDHCINVAKYDAQGNLKSFVRSCSPYLSPPACVPGIDRHSAESYHLCYLMCSHNGCNGSRSVHHLLNLLRRRRK